MKREEKLWVIPLKKKKKSFSFQQALFLCAYCEPGTVLGAKAIAMNKSELFTLMEKEKFWY